MCRCWDEGSDVLDVAGCTGVGRCSVEVTSWMWLGVQVFGRAVWKYHLGCGWVYRRSDEGSNVLDVAGCTGVGTSGVVVTSWMWLGVQVLGPAVWK